MDKTSLMFKYLNEKLKIKKKKINLLNKNEEKNLTF